MRDRAAVVVLALVANACRTAPVTSASTGSCNDPPRGGSVTIETPGCPFQALPSADGCWIFASVVNPPNGGSIALYRRGGGAISLVRVLPLDAGATGMALTHDGTRLFVAGGRRTAIVDVGKLTSGRTAGAVTYVDDPTAAGRVYANVTKDDHYAFIADENSATISVLDVSGPGPKLVGKIPTGRSPIALTLSADNRFMYATSQAAPPGYRWPIECKREGAPADTTPVNPQAAIHIVDVERAKTDPANSIIASVPAGCNAVRLVLSPAGDRAYVSARNLNSLLVFDVSKLHSDRAHALIARVPVGTAPVGIAVTNDGKRVIVTNSNRFAGSANDRQSLTVIDAARINEGAGAIVGSIPAGAFPRELRVTSDGRTLVLTNFGSQSIQLIDLSTIR
jgi:DNA-binding beta-propeller fold protein YncE